MELTPFLVWHLITELGNLIITTGGVLVVAVCLMVRREWKMALLWCSLYGMAMLLVVASKIAFIGWGIGIEVLDFTGFSGHAARAGFVYPVLLWIGLRNRNHHWHGAALGVALAWLIAISRVMVHVHSWSEIISGCLLGCCFALLFVTMLVRQDVLPSRGWLLSGFAALLFTSPAHTPVETNPVLVRWALTVSHHQKPYTRQMWRQCRSACINSPNGL